MEADTLADIPADAVAVVEAEAHIEAAVENTDVVVGVGVGSASARRRRCPDSTLLPPSLRNYLIPVLIPSTRRFL